MGLGGRNPNPPSKTMGCNDSTHRKQYNITWGYRHDKRLGLRGKREQEGTTGVHVKETEDSLNAVFKVAGKSTLDVFQADFTQASPNQGQERQGYPLEGLHILIPHAFPSWCSAVP
jgi:hypothetical protein